MSPGLSATTESLVLTGFMGTGKSCLGKALADRLHVTFTDTDASIEETTGQSISSLFEKFGEEHFRKVEAEIFEKSLIGSTVIATGGGTLLHENNLNKLPENFKVICLIADQDVLWQRISLQAHRPLIGGQPDRKKFEALFEKRHDFYNSFEHRLDTSKRSVDELVQSILKIIGVTS